MCICTFKRLVVFNFPVLNAFIFYALIDAIEQKTDIPIPVPATDETNNEHLMKLLADEAQFALKGVDTEGTSAGHIRFSIWDLAGQTLYHETAHMLLTK